MIKRALALLVLPASDGAQTPPPPASPEPLTLPDPSTLTNRYTPTATIPLGDSLLSLPTSHIPSEGTWEVKFTHRFNQSLDQGSFSDRVHSLYGLDSNADVGIGFSYVITRDLQATFMRSNASDDIESSLKYIVVQQAPAIPFSLA